MLTPVSWLVSPLSVSGTRVVVASSSPLLVDGTVIQIHDEKLLITSVNATCDMQSCSFEVIRGYFSTTTQPHATVSGGSSCVCNVANGNATGGITCGCTSVSVVRLGATRADSGIDIGETGYLGQDCRTGAPSGEGCNPLKYAYYKNLRTHQSVDILEKVSRKVRSVSGEVFFLHCIL